jgi:hypothetical protein
MAFVRKQGKTKYLWLPIGASGGAIAAGSLVALSSGGIIVATSSTKQYYIIGVLRHAIATTDADYAVARTVEVEVPVEKNVIWTADVTATLVAADVGLYCDLTDGATVNRAASVENVAFCTKLISTTKGEFILNIGPESQGDLD